MSDNRMVCHAGEFVWPEVSSTAGGRAVRLMAGGRTGAWLTASRRASERRDDQATITQGAIVACQSTRHP